MCENLSPQPMGPFGLWGYNHPYEEQKALGKQVAIPARFERAERFSEGLAPVRINGYWGFIDQSGETVIPAIFSSVGTFRNGLAEAVINAHAGIIDRDGRFVIEPQFGRIIPVTADAFFISHNHVVEPWMLRFDCQLQGLESVSTNPAVIGGIYRNLYRCEQRDLSSCKPIGGKSSGLLWAFHGPSGLSGLLDVSKGWIREPAFKDVRVLGENYAAVKRTLKIEDGVGLMGTNGEYVVEPGVFDHFSSMGLDKKHYLVVKERKCGVIDVSGRLLIGNKLFDQIRCDRDFNRYVVFDDGRSQYMTTKGEIYNEPEKETHEVVKTYASGWKVITEGAKIKFENNRHEIYSTYRFLDENNEPLFPQEVDYFSKGSDDYITVKIGEKWDFITPSGRLMCGPPHYDGLGGGFLDNTATTKLGNRWNVIDREGKTLFSKECDHLRHYFTPINPVINRKSEHIAGYYEMIRGQDRFVLNEYGETCPEPVAPIRQQKLIANNSGFTIKNYEEFWGLADNKGHFIIEPKFRALTNFKDGITWVADDSRRAWCPVGIDGKRRTNGRPPEKISMFPFLPNGYEQKKLHDDAYEDSVLWSRWWLEAYTGMREDAPPVRDTGMR